MSGGNIDHLTLLGVAFALGLMLLSAFVGFRVRSEKPGLWADLGSPALFSSEPHGVGRFWRWVFRGELKGLSTTTVGAVWILRVGSPLYLLFFIAMVLRVFS